MRTNNIGFYEDLKKSIFELSSNMHLISSAGLHISPRSTDRFQFFIETYDSHPRTW